ncbi:MAG: ABC-2 family transporter protein, partial [Propionibacteriaceae bacterium]|nr:ABC-2 family transporter protein [Propionibacteriaceae bacterium]
MRRYLELAKGEFRRYSTYRLAIAAGIFTNTVFGFIRAGVLFAAIDAAGGEIAGYDTRQAATYVWLGQAMLAPVAMYAWSDVADRVRTGQIAIDLARPIDLQLSYWARDLGRATLALPTRGLPPLVLGALILGVAYPSSWTAYPLGLLSLVLGVSISFM